MLPGPALPSNEHQHDGEALPGRRSCELEGGVVDRPAPKYQAIEHVVLVQPPRRAITLGRKVTRGRHVFGPAQRDQRLAYPLTHRPQPQRLDQRRPPRRTLASRRANPAPHRSLAQRTPRLPVEFVLFDQPRAAARRSAASSRM